MVNIKIIVGADYEDMSRISAELMLGYMYKNRRVNLAITAGRTPVKMYSILAPLVKDKKYFSNVYYYNFDEIPHKVKKNEGITLTDLRTFYYTPAGINEANICKLDETNYTAHDDRIKADGGLDAIFMGIGVDGHYCGNLPGTTKFSDYTTKVNCDVNMKKNIAMMFDSEEDVPDYYITMGPRSVMSARHLVLMASGNEKADIIKQILTQNVEETIPATMLTMHPNLTVILDEAAASRL